MDFEGKSDMKQFYNTRARLTCKNNGTEVYGWVAPSIPDKLFLTFDRDIEIKVGDAYVVQLAGAKSSTEFESTYEGQYQGKWVFQLPRLLRIDPPKEQTRRKTGTTKGWLILTEGREEVHIVDVAPTGISFHGGQSFENGDTVKVEIETQGGIVSIKGEVIYSRFDTEKQDSFRTGIKITELGRIDQARWAQMLAA